jgi:hypothetical protein
MSSNALREIREIPSFKTATCGGLLGKRPMETFFVLPDITRGEP